MEFLSDNLQKFLEAARKRPELANVNSPFRASVPQIYADVDREKLLEAGRGGGRRLPDAPGLPGRGVREPVQPLRPAVAGVPPGRGRGPRGARGHRPVPRAQQRRQHAAALDRRDHAAHLRPRVHAALQPAFAPPRSPASPPPATARGRPWPRSKRWRSEVLPREMGYDWADLSYQEKKAAGRAGMVFALSLGFVFLILAALYESWSLPFSVLLSVPVAVAGAFLGLYLARLRPRRLRPDRPRDADRARGQERDPHRRVRQGRIRARPAPGGRGPRGRAPPPAADPHDVLRVHPRLRAPLDRQGRGGGRTPGPGHRGHLRDARGHRHRDLRHPGALRGGGAAGRGRARHGPPDAARERSPRERVGARGRSALGLRASSAARWAPTTSARR